MHRAALFGFFSLEAHKIPDDPPQQYALDGEPHFTVAGGLNEPSISQDCNLDLIIGKFSDTYQLGNAENLMQSLFYAA